MPFGILSGLLQTGMDYGMSKIARQDNYDYWKRSNDRMFAQQQKAEQLSVRNRAEGLKMAGLNPSLAGQSSPMALVLPLLVAMFAFAQAEQLQSCSLLP